MDQDLQEAEEKTEAPATVEVFALAVGEKLRKVLINPKSLLEIYALVNGGPLEMVPLTESLFMWCNEEGKIRQPEPLPMNMLMGGIDLDGKVHFDPILGDVFFSSSDAEGEIAPLSPTDEALLRKLLPNRS